MTKEKGEDRLSTAEVLVADGLVRVREAAQFTGLSKSTIYTLMDSGRLAYVTIGRSRRIPRRALLRLASTNLVGGEE